MMMASATTSAAVSRNQHHREEMNEDAAAVEQFKLDYQIVRIAQDLSLDAYKTGFVEHYKEVYKLEEADNLYLPDAVRVIEVISSNGKCEKKNFKNPQILESYKHYAIRDLVIDYATIHRTNYLIFMTIVGKCKFRGQECHVNLDLVQNANEDPEDMSVSYLIAYEHLVINTSCASNVETHKIENKQTFNFGSKKPAHSKVIMQNNNSSSSTAAPVSRPIANKQQQQQHQNGTYERNFDPIISSSSNTHSHTNVPSTMSEDHEDRFSIQSQQQQVQQKEKNFSSSRVSAKSVPLMTDQSDKKEDQQFLASSNIPVDSSQYSKYTSLMGQNRAFSNKMIKDIVYPSNGPAETTNDGEQRMPNSMDKFQSKGSKNPNYENSSRNRNGPRQSNNRQYSKNEIYVVNFGENVTQDQIKEAFSKFGVVQTVNKKSNVKTEGFYAHVRFATEDEAKRAVEENEKFEIDGKPVTIKYKSYNDINYRNNGMRGERSDRSGDRRPYNSKRGSSGPNSPKKSNANNSQAPNNNKATEWDN